MAFVIWAGLGVVIALVMSALRRGRTPLAVAGAPLLAGGFGGVIGGIISDGDPQVLAGTLNITSIGGAAVGALLFCLAIRAAPADVAP